MLGAIIGDIVGSSEEIIRESSLFNKDCSFTKYSVFTIAVARAFVLYREIDSFLETDLFRNILIYWMQKCGKSFPNAGYSEALKEWIISDDPQPYHHCNSEVVNIVSVAGFVATTLKEAISSAETIISVIDSNPDNIRAAKAVAACIFLARAGYPVEAIKIHAEKHYYLLDSIRNGDNRKSLDKTALSLIAFFESKDFEDAIRKAISFGGNSVITGAIAEAYYGIPYILEKRVKGFLPAELLLYLNQFQSEYQKRGNENITSRYHPPLKHNIDELETDKLDFPGYKAYPILALDEYDIDVYCDSIFSRNKTISFTPYFKLYLDEVLFRFLDIWFIVEKTKTECIGNIRFFKIHEDNSIVSFEMEIQPNNKWEEIMPCLFQHVFRTYQTEKIIAPKNNISIDVCSFYKKIGMKDDSETYLYSTSWGDIEMPVFSVLRQDYIKEGE